MRAVDRSGEETRETGAAFFGLWMSESVLCLMMMRDVFRAERATCNETEYVLVCTKEDRNLRKGCWISVDI